MNLKKVRNNENRNVVADPQVSLKRKKHKGINNFQNTENVLSTETIPVTDNEKNEKKTAPKQDNDIAEENGVLNHNLRSSSKKNKRKNSTVEDTENVTQPTEVIDSSNESKKQKKFKKSSSKLENNATAESEVEVGNQCLISTSETNDNVTASIGDVSEGDTSSISKKKKRKRKYNGECDSKEHEIEQNGHKVQAITTSNNVEIEKRLEVQNEQVQPTEGSSPKKRKRNRNNVNNSKEPEITPKRNIVIDGPTTQTEKSIIPSELGSPKKMKKKNTNECDTEIESKIESNIPTNDQLSSEASPKKKRKNKNKILPNSNNQKLLSSDKSVQNETPASIPLKSVLKKKKRKKKKKSTDQIKPTDTDPNIDWKKGKSVTFAENVQVELIESCKTTVPDEKAELANTRKKEKAEAYLKRWKEDRSKWRFEKLTQLWLLKNMYQENMVPTETFEIVLEYLVDLKGASRDLVIDLSEKIMAKMEQKTAEENDPELETAYSRARSVLQFMR